MKNFLTSPVSNAVIIAAAVLFALLSWLGGGAGSDVTGLSLTGANTTNFGNVVADNVTAGTITATNLVSQVVGTNAAYITATSALSTAALSVGGYTQSGAVRFGSGTVVSGTTIAHGFGTTPTSFVVQNALIQALVYTQSLYSGGCNTTSCTVYFSQGAITTTTANWMAGK